MSSPLLKESFPVTGMSCASCAASVESTLKHTKGVQDAAVNYANQLAWVSYDPTVSTPLILQKAIQAVGYDLIIEHSEDEEEEAEQRRIIQLRKLRRQTWTALSMSVPVAIIGMFFMDMPHANIIQLALSAPIVFGVGFPFFQRAFLQALHGKASMDTLVALSTGIAFLYSVFNTFFPEFWHQQGLHPHVYYEASAVIIAFVSLGKWLEEKATAHTSSAIRKLMKLQVKTVQRIINGKEEEVPISLVMINDTLLVKAGDHIPVDGTVLSGESYVDESSMTGESMPAHKSAGDKLYAGSINQQGLLHLRAEKVGKATVLAQIIQRVKEAQGTKAPVQKIADRIAGIFVPVVLLLSTLTYLAWWYWGGEQGAILGLSAAITVLVIACPCALGLATPTAIMAGIGKAAEHHILIKDAESLEKGCLVDVLVLDKTGTLTQGKPSVQASWWLLEEQHQKEILFTITSASTHPLSMAIAEELSASKPALLSREQYINIPGKGIEATVEGNSYYVGNRTWIAEKGITDTRLEEVDTNPQAATSTLVYFANNKEVLAILSISDSIREEAATAVAELKEQGIDVYMLTGDREASAKMAAAHTGIVSYRANMLPTEKALFIQDLQRKGKTVAMIGDGINDAQALAQADVSIAMGKGADIALDVAKVTLLTSDLRKIPEAFRLSQQTVRVIRQNLFWAFIYNLIGIPVAAGVLYRWNILLDPMMASAAMALSSVSVVLNSLRLKKM